MAHHAHHAHHHVHGAGATRKTGSVVHHEHSPSRRPLHARSHSLVSNDDEISDRRRALRAEIARLTQSCDVQLEPPQRKVPPRTTPGRPLGLERAHGPTVSLQALDWAEGVRERERTAAAERRVEVCLRRASNAFRRPRHVASRRAHDCSVLCSRQEWRAVEARQAAAQRAAEERAAAGAAEAAAEAAAAAPKVDWAEQAMAAMARERAKEAEPMRVAWLRAHKTVDKTRKLALGVRRAPRVGGTGGRCRSGCGRWSVPLSVLRSLTMSGRVFDSRTRRARALPLAGIKRRIRGEGGEGGTVGREQVMSCFVARTALRTNYTLQLPSAEGTARLGRV
jgi:hypothetical protein